MRTQPREEQAATQPENADVVRLMSIHQAKGLEFPVVFVPDLAPALAEPKTRRGLGPAAGLRGPTPSGREGATVPSTAWKMVEAGEKVADWHEDLRTLYVACTRAKDYLVLSASLPESFPAINVWTATLTERFDLNSGACPS